MKLLSTASGQSLRVKCVTLCSTLAFFLSTTALQAGNIIWTGSFNQDIGNLDNYAAWYNPATDTYGPAPNPADITGVQFTDAGTLILPGAFTNTDQNSCFDNSDLGSGTGSIRSGNWELHNGSDLNASFFAPVSGPANLLVDGTSSFTLARKATPIVDSVGNEIAVYLAKGAKLTLWNERRFDNNHDNRDIIYFANSSGVVKNVAGHLADVGGTATEIDDLAAAGYGTLSGTSPAVTFEPAYAWTTAPYTSACPLVIPVPEPDAAALLGAMMLWGLFMYKRS